MKRLISTVVALLCACSLSLLASEGPVTLTNDPATQTWRFAENGLPVLDYHFGTVPRPAGQATTYFGKGATNFDGSYFTDGSEYGGARSAYIQPLYGFAGEPLTDDFPADHPHHRGLWWSWCEVRQGDRLGDNWAVNKVRTWPVAISNTQCDESGASLTAENVWLFDNDPVPFVKEVVTIAVSPTKETEQGKSRFIDLTVTLTALADQVSIAGRQNCDYCGYGGMAVRMLASATDFSLRAVHPNPDKWSGADLKDTERITDPEKYGQAAWLAIHGRYLRPGQESVDPATPVTSLTMIEATDVPLAPSNFRYYGSRNIMIAWPGFSVIQLEKGQPTTFRCRFWLQEGTTRVEEEWQQWKDYNTNPQVLQKDNASMSKEQEEFWCYAGTYTREANDAMKLVGVGASEGIYVTSWNSETGQYGPVRLVAKTYSPGYMTTSADHKILYVVEEGSPSNGTANVSAWAINGATGDLSLLNRVATGGGSPCHLTLSPDGRFLVVANYSGGDFVVFALNDDGTIGQETDRVTPTGQPGPNAGRQEKPHAHGAYYINDMLYLVDLGCDRVYRGTLDGQGKFVPDATVPELQGVPGAGPRHIAPVTHTDPSANKAADLRLVTINELDSTVSFYNPEQGAQPVLTLSTLPEDLRDKVTDAASAVDGERFVLANTTSELAVRPGEPYVYASNRGHNSIACYAVEAGNPDNAKLIDIVSTHGVNPRYIGLSPDGRFLLAANQDSGTVVVFQRDLATGRVDHTPVATFLVPWPIDLLFVPKSN
ncbi:MAG: beta-propeller fold lactonase family protein [Planctomycetia bacterium]|nr:beta-propeller fold lactonase family protein [Planctomycetia bacterium]